MTANILVTYATRYGSTQEVAEAVAAELRTLGLAVEIQPMRNVKTLHGYQQIVLGAPIYIGRLAKDARRFLTQHQDALQTRPVALFALGPTTLKEEDWRNVRTQFEQILAHLSWLKPVSALLAWRLRATQLGNGEAL
ncbi:MAG: flavodoxin domain-containing protein [Caldilineaceae bacterium]